LAPQAAANPATASDLISFLKALPDCRMRRGIRFPQWWMLLVASLSILSGQGSLVGMERFAKEGLDNPGNSSQLGLRLMSLPSRTFPSRQLSRLSLSALSQQVGQ
jgi:hypothetical protein